MSKSRDVIEKVTISETDRQLLNTFNRQFLVVRADSPRLKETVFRLRYDVYCKEHTYEDPDAYPDGQETDEYDHHSVHTLLVGNGGATAAGTARLILPNRDALHASFPIQRLCSHPMLTDRCGILPHAAELSRFAVSKSFRQSTSCGGQADERRQVMPFLVLGIIRGLVQMSLEHDVTELFAVMEPSLLRLLARYSIYFQPVGPIVQHHGMRLPCHSHVPFLLQTVRRERPGIWEILTDAGKLFSSDAAYGNAWSWWRSETTALMRPVPGGYRPEGLSCPTTLH